MANDLDSGVVMLSKASITPNGAVLLGKYTACDAFDEARPLRIVTHAHYDHMVGLEKSLTCSQVVMMTSATKDLIGVLRSPLFLTSENVRSLEYGKPFYYGNEKIVFHFADHILGAAQVLVENAEGTRIVYTSDFRLPNTPIIEADILVMEATYGHPSRSRPFKENVESTLVSIVEQGIKKGRACLFGYHGKIQEAMQILHESGLGIPFIVPEKVYTVSKVCEKHGMKLGRYLLSTSAEAMALLQKNEPHISFHHMRSRKYIEKDAFRIYLSGWEFKGPYRKISDTEYVVAFSDHSDFEGLLQYVERSRPNFVITDNHRIGDAITLAKEIERRLKIPAKPLPNAKQ